VTLGGTITSWNLHRMTGRRLDEVKRDELLKRIPVVVLTSSSAAHDVIKSYNLEADCYATKPVDLSAFQTIVGETSRFWFTVVRLPA